MTELFTEAQARTAIVDIGRRVYQNGYVGANDGNISCRTREGTIVVTPTGVSKGYMTEEMLVVMQPDGTVLGPGKPSSEVKMHLRAYQDNPSIHGVVHVHPPVATAFSTLGMGLEKPLVAEGVLVTGNIPLVPYAKPGTYAVPDGIAPFLQDYNGVLLERHGALTWGSDVYQALYRMEALEHQAKILCYALLLSRLTGREIQPFTRAQLDDLVEIRRQMGVSTGGIPKN